jgi:hypothetical protein
VQDRDHLEAVRQAADDLSAAVADPRPTPMTFEWYQRGDSWQVSACDAHGTELVAMGFRLGVLPRFAADLGAAELCTFCRGTTSIADVRACCCDVPGEPCPVHGLQDRTVGAFEE